MVAASPLILGKNLKISNQNNWGEGWRTWAKNYIWGRAKFKGRPKILGGPMNPNDVMVVVLKDIFWCWLGFRFIYIVYISWYYILYIRCFKCVTTTNMLVFWSSCLFCLLVCQSKFNGWFRSQGKYRATLECKSSGCAVSNNLIYDSSLSQSKVT